VLAWHLAERGIKLDEALELAQRAMDLQPKNPDRYDTLGWIQYKRKAYAEAEAALLEAVRLYGPGKPASDSLVRLGAVYEATERREKAVESYREALKLDPGNKETQEALRRLGG
jgi:tetratricopeptide (TPR) repeat protein